eukprot:Unigene7124_Nuclearia_a/m.21844 Unigene7124_Nuclearia_a/g.21844  ORF Unigene7124_Nuclearia_a/g.21844 Unigene7124_Nuclearia_a/m.21844 type:complete len:403 (+) Unigene7124_Nuclearia_a:283-1491(+)
MTPCPPRRGRRPMRRNYQRPRRCRALLLASVRRAVRGPSRRSSTASSTAATTRSTRACARRAATVAAPPTTATTSRRGPSAGRGHHRLSRCRPSSRTSRTSLQCSCRRPHCRAGCLRRGQRASSQRPRSTRTSGHRRTPPCAAQDTRARAGDASRLRVMPTSTALCWRARSCRTHWLGGQTSSTAATCSLWAATARASGPCASSAHRRARTARLSSGRCRSAPRTRGHACGCAGRTSTDTRGRWRGARGQRPRAALGQPRRRAGWVCWPRRRVTGASALSRCRTRTTYALQRRPTRSSSHSSPSGPLSCPATHSSRSTGAARSRGARSPPAASMAPWPCTTFTAPTPTASPRPRVFSTPGRPASTWSACTGRGRAASPSAAPARSACGTRATSLSRSGRGAR